MIDSEVDQLQSQLDISLNLNNKSYQELITHYVCVTVLRSYKIAKNLKDPFQSQSNQDWNPNSTIFLLYGFAFFSSSGKWV